MSDREHKRGWKRFADWVNGDVPPHDPTTQYVMKCRRSRPCESLDVHEQKDRVRLKKFLDLYPIAAGFLCCILIGVLLVTALNIPPFGQPGNPTNNEVSKHYLEYTEVETGATNAVTGMILSYRGFDTLGESCVLFLAVSSVMMLLQRDKNNTDERTLCKLGKEDAAERMHPDNILRKTAKLLIPFIFMFALYVLLNGEVSPGGGFSGGAILGSALILYSSAFGPEQASRVLTRKRYDCIRILGLILYACTYGLYIFVGANEIELHMEWMMMLIDIAVGLVVACTVYGFYAMIQRGKI